MEGRGENVAQTVPACPQVGGLLSPTYDLSMSDCPWGGH